MREGYSMAELDWGFRWSVIGGGVRDGCTECAALLGESEMDIASWLELSP